MLGDVALASGFRLALWNISKLGEDNGWYGVGTYGDRVLMGSGTIGLDGVLDPHGSGEDEVSGVL